jgi:hypothetical protein
MDFQGFVRFITDFSVFPDVVTKSDAYRIFMNLAFPHETVAGGLGNENMAFKVTQNINLDSSKLMNSTASVFGSKRGSFQTQVLQKQIIQVLDIHLFVEALAFCALHIDTRNSFLILQPHQIGFEKILMLIEKMSVSDGLRRMKEKRFEDHIKTIGAVEKVDLMLPFRRRYQWYFEMREHQASLNRSLKISK